MTGLKIPVVTLLVLLEVIASGANKYVQAQSISILLAETFSCMHQTISTSCHWASPRGDSCETVTGNLISLVAAQNTAAGASSPLQATSLLTVYKEGSPDAETATPVPLSF